MWAGSPPGTIYGPTTLADIISKIPDDCSLDEVIVDYRDGGEDGVEFVLRKLVLNPESAKNLAKYELDIANYIKEMEVYSAKKLAWLESYPERKKVRDAEALAESLYERVEDLLEMKDEDNNKAALRAALKELDEALEQEAAALEPILRKRLPSIESTDHPLAILACHAGRMLLGLFLGLSGRLIFSVLVRRLFSSPSDSIFNSTRNSLWRMS